MREVLSAATAPVVAVSPWVGGRVVKGPTDAFCAHAGIQPGPAGVLEAYGDLVEGIVSDEELGGTPVPLLRLDTLMDSRAAERELAARTLEFAESLTRGRADHRRRGR
jgi:LPPG:FO 2-phospho-L-lactate transferase